MLIKDEVCSTLFLSLFVILDIHQIDPLAYEKYVPIVLSCRICGKHFQFAFYHPENFNFRRTSYYFFHNSDGIVFHNYDSGFYRVHVLTLPNYCNYKMQHSFQGMEHIQYDEHAGLMSRVDYSALVQGGLASTPSNGYIHLMDTIAARLCL